MNNKYYHNLSAYPELSPSVMVYSLLMHLIVLFFLLTLPMYSRVNEKESLFAYHVYLTGEKTNEIQASTGRNVPGKQTDAAKNKEEITPSAEPVKPSYTEPKKEAEIVGKETDNIEKTKTVSPAMAVKNEVQTEKPVEPLIQPEAISPGIDQVQKQNVENLSGGDGRKNIERPASDLQLPPKKDASASEMKLPARNSTEYARMDIERPVIVLRPPSGKDISEIKINLPERSSQATVQLSAEMTEKPATIKKGEAKIEKPLTSDQTLSVNNVVASEKKAIHKPDENNKALSGKITDTPGDKKILPLIKKPAEKAPIKKSPLSVTSKTEETVSAQKNGEKIEAPKTIVNPEHSKTTAQTVVPAQSHAQEDSGQRVLGIKNEKVLRLLPDIDNIIKKTLLGLQPSYEETQGVHTEAESSVTPLALAGGEDGSYIRTEKAETDIKYDKGPEKNEKAISKINDKVEKGAKAEEEKSALGLPMDESLFNRDIKIEVLQRNAESHGVYMYLLKNTYPSLSKRHTWGKEKKIETIVETKRKKDAENEMKTVYSVAKSDEGIYTFVIENRNTVPYNTEVVFVLYGGQKRERIKKISAVSVSPSSMLRFMFVLPDTVFWDDEKFFSGSIEDSDSITKFNAETGFVWKEGKDH